MSRWHTDRQEPAEDGHTLARCQSVGRLAGVDGRQGLALGLSRQNGVVWLVAFAVAIAAHLLMTLWLMMTVAPQTGTQQPASVSMLFEAPKAPLPEAEQAKTDARSQTPSDLAMKEMPDMDAASLAQDTAAVLPPSVRAEADHLPPALAVPKKLAVVPPHIHHDGPHGKTATPRTDAAPTGVDHQPTHAHAQTEATATGGQAAAPASAAAAGQKGGFQLSCSAPEAHYPVSARHLHEEGEAVAEVSINGKGQVIAARLVKSTGYDDLDDQALQTVKNLRCTPPASAVVTGRIPVGFHIQ